MRCHDCSFQITDTIEIIIEPIETYQWFLEKQKRCPLTLDDHEYMERLKQMIPEKVMETIHKEKGLNNV